MVTNYINIADLVDPKDSQGRTYRQINATKVHNIPIGTLVEVEKLNEDYLGIRLFVVLHHRDCDQTPLYALAWDKDNTVQERPHLHNANWFHGLPEECLKVIKE